MKPSTILAVFASFAVAAYAIPEANDEGPLSLEEMFERDGLFPEEGMSPAENLVEFDERAEANPPWNINFYSGKKCRPSISQTVNTVPIKCSKVPFGPARSYLFQSVGFWKARLYRKADCSDAGVAATPGNSCHFFNGEFVSYIVAKK